MWSFWLIFVIENLILNIFLPAGELSHHEDTYIIVIAITSLALLLCLASSYRHDRKLVALLIGSYIFRICVLLWIQYCSDILLLPNAGFDEYTFYYNAQSYLVHGKQFTGYPGILSLMMSVHGLSLLFGRYVNVLFSMTTLCIFNTILHRLGVSEKTRYLTMGLACFLPNFAIMSAVLLRESLVIMFVAITIYFFIRWWHEDNWTFFVISAISTLPAVLLHSGMIAVSAGILCIAIASTKKETTRCFDLTNARTITVCLVAFVGFMAITLIPSISDSLGLSGYFRDADSVGDIVSVSKNYLDGESAYDANIIEGDSLPAFIINTPFRIFYFMLSPLPWDWRGLNDIIAFGMSGIFYFGVFSFALYSIIKRKKEISPMVPALFFISILVLIIFAWGCSNSGTALRHRDKMVMLYLTIFAYIVDKFNFKQPQKGINKNRS